MKKRKIKSKKGQERTSTLGWIIGLVAVLLVGFFLWTVWGYFNKSVGQLPEDVVLRREVCSGYASSDNSAYCTEFKELELDEGKIWSNCQYSLIEEAMDDFVKCGENEGVAFCLRKKQDPDFSDAIRVFDGGKGIIDCEPLEESGGVACADLGGSETLTIGWESDCLVGEDVTMEVTDKNNFNSNIGKRCCKSSPSDI